MECEVRASRNYFLIIINALHHLTSKKKKLIDFVFVAELFH